ncbi:hypothetical protein BDV95DRAFT_68584 [Massariosphaeria phaeospora]|uniref:Uncharacterized protein n=1 Tax=Massariosphaeria phaeospora TaxID=100035 RepID=A0A7C8M576_9PLEO|nr:hypothetical protein BDV95DRAFT_68584 [Massariosphaeria phaeospora]
MPPPSLQTHLATHPSISTSTSISILALPPHARARKESPMSRAKSRPKKSSSVQFSAVRAMDAYRIPARSPPRHQHRRQTPAANQRARSQKHCVRVWGGGLPSWAGGACPCLWCRGGGAPRWGWGVEVRVGLGVVRGGVRRVGRVVGWSSPVVDGVRDLGMMSRTMAMMMVMMMLSCIHLYHLVVRSSVRLFIVDTNTMLCDASRALPLLSTVALHPSLIIECHPTQLSSASICLIRTYASSRSAQVSSAQHSSVQFHPGFAPDSAVCQYSPCM